MTELSVDIRMKAGAFDLDVEFVAKGGITVLFGPSGAGKSTTLAAIAGLKPPLTGRISLDDQVWFDSKRNLPTHQRGVAIVFQSLALFPHMTALENVLYGITRELPKAERLERAASTLERMHVPHLKDRKPRSFSGGEAQRVALARAFATHPKIVLLDEPFSAMDRDLRLTLATEVRNYANESGIPFIHVTHHHNEARALADRLVLIEHGRVARIGSADECLPPPGDSVPMSSRLMAS